MSLVRGNQQRVKTTIEGITKVEAGKRPIWHFYFYVYTDTTALGHRFPRTFHVTLDDGENFNLDYAVRSSVECVTPEGDIAIHGAPGGCKGYDKPWAISYLRKNQISFRQCTCEQDKAKAEQRKRRAARAARL